MRSRTKLLVLLLLVPASLHALEDRQWEQTGRPLPAPMAVQAAVDAGLPPFGRCRLAAAAGGESKRLEGSASAILAQLALRWSAHFESLCPGMRVNVPPPYSAPQADGSPRLRAFLAGQLDFALLSRDLSDTDTAAFRSAHGRMPVTIPVAGGSYAQFGFLDAVAIIVQRDNPLRRLNVAQLQGILLGRLHTWGDVGLAGRWSVQPLHVLGDTATGAAESARAQFLRLHVFAASAREQVWRSDLQRPADSSPSLEDRVAADPLAIAFTGLGHLNTSVRAIAIRGYGQSAYLAPDFRHVAAASYPLARTVNLLVDLPSARPPDPLLAEFLRFLLSREAQRDVREQGVFLPLRATQAQVAARDLRSRLPAADATARSSVRAH